MPLLTAPYEDAIKAQVETATPRVWVTEVPAEVPTPQTPYVVLYFGGPVRTAFDHHMALSQNDSMVAYCTIQVVSRTDISARDVADRVRQAMLGFVPPNSGQTQIEGALSYSNATEAAPPTLFYREIGLTFVTNQVSDN